MDMCGHVEIIGLTGLVHLVQYITNQVIRFFFAESSLLYLHLGVQTWSTVHFSCFSLNLRSVSGISIAKALTYNSIIVSYLTCSLIRISHSQEKIVCIY